MKNSFLRLLLVLALLLLELIALRSITQTADKENEKDAAQPVAYTYPIY